jgi:hypothetical protein
MDPSGQFKFYGWDLAVYTYMYMSDGTRKAKGQRTIAEIRQGKMNRVYKYWGRLQIRGRPF